MSPLPLQPRRISRDFVKLLSPCVASVPSRGVRTSPLLLAARDVRQSNQRAGGPAPVGGARQNQPQRKMAGVLTRRIRARRGRPTESEVPSLFASGRPDGNRATFLPS